MSMNVNQVFEETEYTKADGTPSVGKTKQKITDGAAHVGVVFTGPLSQTHNRNINAASTTYNTSTNTATWTAAENITNIIVHVIGATAAAIQNDEACLVVFDAPDATTASLWLSDAGAASDDVEYSVVWPGTYKEFSFTDALRRIDVLPLAVNMRVVVEAV